MAGSIPPPWLPQSRKLGARLSHRRKVARVLGLANATKQDLRDLASEAAASATITRLPARKPTE